MSIAAIQLVSSSAPQKTDQLSFDSSGDVILVLAKGSVESRFQVNSGVLSVASPVFGAMLGSRSGFQEASRLAKAQATGIPMELQLEDDDPKALATILWAIHNQYDKVPQSLTELELYEVAILCDKYDIATAISVWTKHVWIPPLRPASISSCGDRWLFMSYVFALVDIFENLTARFLSTKEGVLKAGQMDDVGRVDEPKYSIAEHLPQRIIEAMETEIFDRNKHVLELTSKLLDDYMDNNTTWCKQKNHMETCDGLILGCLIRRLKKYSLFPVPDSTKIASDFDFSDLQLFLKSLSTPWRFFKGTGIGSSTCSCCPGPSMEIDHSTSCSPLPAFLKAVNAIYDDSKGLAYHLFVRKPN